MEDDVEITSDEYWDCECQQSYIHKKSEEKKCPVCGFHHFEMPDSIKTEVEHFKKLGILK